MAVLQVIGCLTKAPYLLLDDRYPLNQDDFPERFHKIVFTAVENLIKKGAQEITPISIDHYIANYPKQYKTFTDNDGMDYIDRASALCETDNYDLYYTILKKFALLQQLDAQGFDVKRVYDSSLLNVDDSEKMQKKFDEMSLEDIINQYELPLAELRQTFSATGYTTCCQAGDSLDDLIAEWQRGEDFGVSCFAQKFNTIVSGRQPAKLFVRSAGTGVGKTKAAIGDACYASVGEIYDPALKKWVYTQQNVPTMFISTELPLKKIKSQMISFIACVSDDHIKRWAFVDDEEERVNRAIEILKKAPLYLYHIPDFSIDDIEMAIKTEKLRHAISLVFFDYLWLSSKAEGDVRKKAGSSSVRSDKLLLDFADRLYVLANQLSVHIDTSTQIYTAAKDMNFADERAIADSKAIANKADVGYVVMQLNKRDKEALKNVIQKKFTRVPNICAHIYKVREGKYNLIRLFSYFDHSTCRQYDLFVTDVDYNLIDVENTAIEHIIEQTSVAELPDASDYKEVKHETKHETKQDNKQDVKKEAFIW